MRNTLFNDEVEGYTNSNAKLYVVGIALLVAFVFIGWAVSQVANLADIAWGLQDLK